MSHGVRIWLTGCLAVVMAAVSAEFARAQIERQLTARHSRYSAGETLRKLESAARGSGYTVFAKVAAPAQEVPDSTALVLALPEGLTPVVVDEQDRCIDAPLAIVVVPLPDGQAEVRFPDPQRLGMRGGEGPQAGVRLVELIDSALA
ncbi:MAG TPA: hypothetical protein VNO84_06920 [Burkholderiaceae bacterium]|nr:hypothetical protein [Burkholderiaceae bacterium]